MKSFYILRLPKVIILIFCYTGVLNFDFILLVILLVKVFLKAVRVLQIFFFAILLDGQSPITINFLLFFVSHRVHCMLRTVTEFVN